MSDPKEVHSVGPHGLDQGSPNTVLLVTLNTTIINHAGIKRCQWLR